MKLIIYVQSPGVCKLILGFTDAVPTIGIMHSRWRKLDNANEMERNQSQCVPNAAILK